MAAPQYIYKILPPSPPPTSPLPETLPLSPLDTKDGFIHLSTPQQLLGTLQKFFSSAPHVYLLRIPYERVEKFVKWESPEGKLGEVGEKGCFPHVYGDSQGGAGCRLGREEVDSVGQWVKGDEGWEVSGWPFEGGRPE